MKGSPSKKNAEIQNLTTHPGLRIANIKRLNLTKFESTTLGVPLK